MAGVVAGDSGHVAAHNNRGLDVTLSDYKADPAKSSAWNTAAIQAAIDDSVSDGIECFIPFGKTFSVSAASNNRCLNLPAGARITGGGTIKLADSQSNFTRLFAPTDGASDIALEGVTLDGNKANQGSGEQRHLLFLDGASDVEVRNVRVKNASGDGIYLVDSSDVRIRNCRISGSGRNGVSMTHGVEEVSIDRCRIWDITNQPIDSEPDSDPSPTGITVTNSKITAGTDWAIAVGGRSTSLTSEWRIAGNTISGGIFMVRAEKVKIRGNTIIGSSSGNGRCVYGAYELAHIDVDGNYVEGPDGATSNDGVVGFVYTNSEPITDLSITNNQIVSLEKHPIKVFGASVVKVHDNQVRCDEDVYLIWLRDTAAAEDVSVQGNQLYSSAASRSNAAVYVHGAGDGFTTLLWAGNTVDVDGNAVEFVAAGSYSGVVLGDNAYGPDVGTQIVNDPT